MGFFHLKKNRVKDEYNYIIETLVYNELIARGYKVYIGKTFKGEVDFIAERPRERIYIQAAYLLTDEKTIDRDGIIHLNLLDFLLQEEVNRL